MDNTKCGNVKSEFYSVCVCAHRHVHVRMLQNPSVFRLCNFISASKPEGGPELHGQCSDLLQAEWFGVHNLQPGGGKIFCTIQSSPRAHPASYTVRTVSCKWVGRSVDHRPPSNTYINTLKSKPVQGLFSANLLCVPRPSAAHDDIFAYVL